MGLCLHRHTEKKVCVTISKKGMCHQFKLRKILYGLLHFCTTLLFKILFDLKIEGREYVPCNQAAIIAANHCSYLDPVAMGVACPQELNYMAKEELFSVPVLKWIIGIFKAFPLSRGSIDRRSLRRALKILSNGEHLLLFPEGTREKEEGRILPLRPGIGMLAYKSRAKVIPAFMKGTSRILPRRAKFIHLRPLSIYFGPALKMERFYQMPDAKETYVQIAAYLRECLQQLSIKKVCVTISEKRYVSPFFENYEIQGILFWGEKGSAINPEGLTDQQKTGLCPWSLNS